MIGQNSEVKVKSERGASAASAFWPDDWQAFMSAGVQKNHDASMQTQ